MYRYFRLTCTTGTSHPFSNAAQLSRLNRAALTCNSTRCGGGERQERGREKGNVTHDHCNHKCCSIQTSTNTGVPIAISKSLAGCLGHSDSPSIPWPYYLGPANGVGNWNNQWCEILLVLLLLLCHVEWWLDCGWSSMETTSSRLLSRPIAK